MGEESPRPNASSRTSNVQDFVQSILSAVTNLQHSSPAGEEHQLTPNRHGGSEQQQQFASSAQEVNFRFQIPRSSAPQPAPRRRVPSQDFNPRQNYSFQRTGRRRPQKQSVSKSAVPAATKSEVVFKDVCLLPGPAWNQVPRGSVKATLVERRLYVDAFRLDKNWDEARPYNELSCLFEKMLKPQDSHEIGCV